ncbi:MAG TPA: hypothetical protein DEQ06_01065 [Porphyromonadaceae bacterium]|nr:hypothetical protein [Porphyromonadaceae bacterium]
MNWVPSRAALQAIKDAGEPLDDDVTIKKNYNWFNIEYKASDRTLVAFTVNEKKVDNARRASGFFANMTLGVDMDPMQALDAYGLRDEHKGKASFITPFVGSQLDICKAFGFDVPQGCAPVYQSKKKAKKKPGRPKKQHPIKLEG